MKKYICTVLFVLSVFLLSGCGELHNPEDWYQVCVDEFLETIPIDLTYDLKDNYASIEESYQEFVNLSVWVEDTWYEIDDVFPKYNYAENDILTKNVTRHGLKWDKLKDMLNREKTNYKLSLEPISERYVLQIVDASCEEIRNNRVQIRNELDFSGISYIATAESERLEKDYKEMFIVIYNTDFPKEIFHKLYPEEVFQGALACIEDPTTKDSIEKASAYFSEAGLYDEYAEKIDWAYDQAHELWRCDFGTCQSEGDTSAERYDGQFCSTHAYYLDNGGKLKNKTESSDFAGVMLPPPDSLEENASGSGEDSASKEESEEKEFPNDPYDVYDYYDPEDFYYDNYDDFWDYEDAEDYWYEAWDKVS